MGQREGHGLARRHGELADRAQVLAAQGRRGPHDDHIGASNGPQRAIVHPGHPRHGGPVVEPKDEFGSHGHLPRPPDDQADEVRAPCRVAA